MLPHHPSNIRKIFSDIIKLTFKSNNLKLILQNYEKYFVSGI